MSELQQILDTWGDLERRGESAVLATVVKIEGSAYRSPGARVLVEPGGRLVGSISAGCLEGDVAKKAAWFTMNGKPIVHRYDTSSPDDSVFEFGIGCDGIVSVLVERLTPGAATPMRFIDTCRRARREGVIATVIGASDESDARIGDRLYVPSSQSVSGRIGNDRIAALVRDDCLQVLRSGRSRNRVYQGGASRVEVFLEFIAPPIQLLVCGARRDAVPVVRLARQLGWRVCVVDTHAGHAKREHFPEADAVRLVAPASIDQALDLDTQTVAVVMTHSYHADLAFLRAFRHAPLRYLGVLGSRRRTARLVDELSEPGGRARPCDLHAPVGLDIGAETPEEVAVSIIAEIQATLRDRQGGKLRTRPGSIHHPCDRDTDGATLESTRRSFRISDDSLSAVT